MYCFNFIIFVIAIHPTGKVPPKLIELRLIQNKIIIEDPVIEIRAEKIKDLKKKSYSINVN